MHAPLSYTTVTSDKHMLCDDEASQIASRHEVYRTPIRRRHGTLGSSLIPSPLPCSAPLARYVGRCQTALVAGSFLHPSTSKAFGEGEGEGREALGISRWTTLCRGPTKSGGVSSPFFSGSNVNMQGPAGQDDTFPIMEVIGISGLAMIVMVPLLFSSSITPAVDLIGHSTKV